MLSDDSCSEICIALTNEISQRKVTCHKYHINRLTCMCCILLCFTMLILFYEVFLNDCTPPTIVVKNITLPCSISNSFPRQRLLTGNTIYVITPTYTRNTQQADLTRLAQTLMLTSQIHWIVVEDAQNTTRFVTELLARMPFSWTHIAVQSDTLRRCRGCTQRNAALHWMKDNHVTDGVMYFADDDNTYDVRLFDEFRNVQEIGIVPTGNLKTSGVSSPIVRAGKIIGFIDPWLGHRKWPVEMASIAINIKFWLNNGQSQFYSDREGYVETRFLENMKITRDNLELKADNCTKILVWHTRTEHVRLEKTHIFRTEFNNTNVPILTQNLVFPPTS